MTPVLSRTGTETEAQADQCGPRDGCGCAWTPKAGFRPIWLQQLMVAKAPHWVSIGAARV